MPSFSDLSNELVLLILDRVLPGDLLSFCLISKHAHHLSADKLARHRVMTQQNHKFCHHWVHGLGDDQLEEWLCQILNDPLVGHYVKWMDFDLCFLEQPRESILAERHKTYLDQQITTFEAAIRSAKLPAHYQDIWLERLAKGGGDIVLALLLLHTPNLERLDIQGSKHRLWYFRNYFPASIAAVAYLASKATFISPCLQHLKRVSLDFGSCKVPLALAKLFMSLPLLTSLTLCSINSNERIQWPIQEVVTLQEASSNVVDLHLSGKFHDREELSEIFKSCRNLVHLSLKFTRYNGSSPRDIRHIGWPDVIAILQSSAEHSLKSLQARIYPSRNRRDSVDDLINCTAFKNLCQIDVDAHMLLKPRDWDYEPHMLLKPEDKFDPKDVIDRLPHSLQRLYLTYGSRRNIEYERNSLRGLENPKLEQLPNLRLLQVNTDDPSTARSIANSLSGSGETFGLDYVVCGGDFQKIFNAVNSSDDGDI